MITETHEGNGSTIILFDLYLDRESNLKGVISPAQLHADMQDMIGNAGMQCRDAHLLDVWQKSDFGPATILQSISESHLRTTSVIPPEILLNFVRLETWPNDGELKEIHINAEAQLCDFSRSNAEATEKLVWDMIHMTQPRVAYLLSVRRGPGPILVPAWRKTYVRGMVDVTRESFEIVSSALEKVPFPLPVAA